MSKTQGVTQGVTAPYHISLPVLAMKPKATVAYQTGFAGIY